MLLGLIGVFAATPAFVQARIAGNARAESLPEYDLKRPTWNRQNTHGQKRTLCAMPFRYVTKSIAHRVRLYVDVGDHRLVKQW